MRVWNIAFGAALAVMPLPVAAQSITPMPSPPRMAPPSVPQVMPDFAVPGRGAAPMAVPPLAAPSSELSSPSERAPPTTNDSGRTTDDGDPRRPGGR